MPASEFRQHSTWAALGTAYTFEIVGIWSRGGGDDYQPTKFELKWAHMLEVQLKTDAEMRELLANNKIKRI